jgi:hypothetical protein
MVRSEENHRDWNLKFQIPNSKFQRLELWNPGTLEL